jgi:hypothetical protein
MTKKISKESIQSILNFIPEDQRTYKISQNRWINSRELAKEKIENLIK